MKRAGGNPLFGYQRATGPRVRRMFAAGGGFHVCNHRGTENVIDAEPYGCRSDRRGGVRRPYRNGSGPALAPARPGPTGAALDEMAALLDHLQRVAHPRRAQALDALDRRYAQRWLAYADLLETQLAVQEAGVPDGLLARAHVPVILAGVRDGSLQTQGDVQQHCGLKEANASRVLALLDAAELVLRQWHGREKRLMAGPRLPEALQLLEDAGRLPLATTPARTATSRRGSSFFKAA